MKKLSLIKLLFSLLLVCSCKSSEIINETSTDGPEGDAPKIYGLSFGMHAGLYIDYLNGQETKGKFTCVSVYKPEIAEKVSVATGSKSRGIEYFVQNKSTNDQDILLASESSKEMDRIRTSQSKSLEERTKFVRKRSFNGGIKQEVKNLYHLVKTKSNEDISILLDASIKSNSVKPGFKSKEPVKYKTSSDGKNWNDRYLSFSHKGKEFKNPFKVIGKDKNRMNQIYIALAELHSFYFKGNESVSVLELILDTDRENMYETMTWNYGTTTIEVKVTDNVNNYPTKFGVDVYIGSGKTPSKSFPIVLETVSNKYIVPIYSHEKFNTVGKRYLDDVKKHTELINGGNRIEIHK